MSLSALPKSTVSLITSGQIVTSVASVVKELLENALDAGATQIEVRLEGFGLDKIEVKDNGSGVAKLNIPLMPAAHFTSKISVFQDLESLTTYGFRGEALHAIANISKLEISSKTADDKIGQRVEFDHSAGVAGSALMAMTDGTKVVARDLFENLPVRRNMYLKGSRKRDDLKRVETLCTAFAIIRPDVRLTLIHDGGVILQKSGCSTLRGSVLSSLGAKVDFAEVEGQSEFARMIMFLPKRADLAKSCKSSTEKTFVFVNRRPVEQKAIMRTLKRICGEVLNDGKERSPICVIAIEVPSQELDQNLDPNKQMVLLKRQDEIVQCLELRLRHFYGLLEASDGANLDSSLIEPNVFEKEKPLDNTLSPSFFIDGKKNTNDLSVNDQSFTEEKDPSRGKEVAAKKRKVIPFPAFTCEKNSAAPENVAVNSETTCSMTVATVTANQDDKTSHLSEKASIYRGAPIVENHNLSLGERTLKNKSFSRQPTLEAWSRGEAVKDGNGVPVAPVAILLSQFFESSKRKSEEKSKNSSSKKARGANESVDMRLDDFLERIETRKKTDPGNRTLKVLAAPNGTPEISRKKRVKIFRKVKSVKFAIDKLSNSSDIKIQNIKKGSKKEFSPVELIGHLEKSPYWIVRLDNEIHLLNHHRIEEVLLFERLQKSHALPSQSVPCPVDLTLTKGWDDNFIRILRAMKVDENNVLMDERFTKSGFFIQMKNEIPVLAKCCKSVINFLCADDVIEILKILSTDELTPLENCRPLKIQNYLLGEAVRMMRQNPPGLDAESVLKLAENMLKKKLQKCLHGKALCAKITDFPTT